MLTTLAFIFVLGVLIFFHELGHFLVAKKVGIRVDKFSLGFPPNIFARKYGGTIYCIGLIPLGGYVKMAGENPDEEATGSKDEFMSKTVLQRAAVIFAGPFMNYALAMLIFIGINVFVGEPYFNDEAVEVGEVVDGSPAMEAGIRAEDKIIAFNGEAVTDFTDLQGRINAVVEGPIELTWISGTDTTTKTIVTTISEIPQVSGEIDTVGVIGFSRRIAGFERRPFMAAVSKGFVDTHMTVYLTVRFVKQLVTGQVSSKMLGGPLFIARESGRQARQGIANLFAFMALLSVNLAVLNVLPIPVLDGGHLVFLGVEAIKGSPLSMKARLTAQQVGIVALLALIVFVTYNDILRLIG